MACDGHFHHSLLKKPEHDQKPSKHSNSPTMLLSTFNSENEAHEETKCLIRIERLKKDLDFVNQHDTEKGKSGNIIPSRGT